MLKKIVFSKGKIGERRKKEEGKQEKNVEKKAEKNKKLAKEKTVVKFPPKII